MDHPLITGGGQMLRSYQIGSYKSVLVKSPESVGPVKYLYVMIVFSGNGTEPVLFVTAERNEMQGELLKIAAGETGNPNLGSEDNEYFLGVFLGRPREIREKGNRDCSRTVASGR